MAVEPKRGCGYRKIGGLYMVGRGVGIPCDRLPFELSVCSCCGQGIKQARGFTWVNVAQLFQGAHLVAPGTAAPADSRCGCWHSNNFCALCLNPERMGRAGLLWIGEKFYKTPDLFVKEGVELGFSRRIKAVPQGFKVGETWVLLAHSSAIDRIVGGDGLSSQHEFRPGVFYVWLPQRWELIMMESQRNSPEAEAAEKRGISPVFVPDDDKDHQGNVHDDLEIEKKKKSEEAE